MTAAEFYNRLGAWGESIQDMQPTLDSISDIVGPQIKADYGKNGLRRRSSNLYNSIEAEAVSNTQITISMLDYGLYNNYGVSGTSGLNPQRLTGGEVLTNNFGTTFNYTNRVFGLPSRNFFDVDDITERIAMEVAVQITEQL